MKSLILGTAQLGMNYGINNNHGLLDCQQSIDILNTAYDNGIHILDTANAYGDSEKIIGLFMRGTNKKFKICTKLNPENSKIGIEDQVENSLQRLQCEDIYVFYLHKFQDCIDKDVMINLQELKKKKYIRNVGISLYEPFELEYIIENLRDMVDIVQIPFNILDSSRWLNNNLLERAHKCNIKVYVRSIYLQGLLLMESNNDIVKKFKLEDYLNFLEQLQIKKRTTLTELLMGYVNNIRLIDRVIVGSETSEQVLDNINIFNKEIYFETEELNQIEVRSRQVKKHVIDPRTWGEYL